MKCILLLHLLLSVVYSQSKIGDIFLCLDTHMNSQCMCMCIVYSLDSTELSVTISVDYIAAPGEDPGKLGPNEFTAGSILTLNCIVEGNSSAVTYTWSVRENPTPPPECRDCDRFIDTLPTTSTLQWTALRSFVAGTYTCTVNETVTPDSSNSADYIVTVVGKMMMCVLYMYCIII